MKKTRKMVLKNLQINNAHIINFVSTRVSQNIMSEYEEPHYMELTIWDGMSESKYSIVGQIKIETEYLKEPEAIAYKTCPKCLGKKTVNLRKILPSRCPVCNGEGKVQE